MNPFSNIYQPEPHKPTLSSSKPSKKLLASLAHQMGIEVKESEWNAYESQANEMWNKLNDLQASDPQKYSEFVQAQMDEASKLNMQQDGTIPQFFVPEVGFAVQAKSGVKVYQGLVNDATLPFTSNSNDNYSLLCVNVCQHRAVQKPMDGKTKNPVKSCTLLRSSDLEVPLLVSSDLRIVKYRFKLVSVIDVVFHPLCIEGASQSKMFQNQLVQLALEWIGKEQSSVDIDTSNCTWDNVCDKNYIGEESVEKFLVTDAMIGKTGDHGTSKDTFLTSKGLIESINKIRAEDDVLEMESDPIILPGSDQKHPRDCRLVQEVESPKTNRKVLVLKKGFLNCTKVK